MARPSKLSPEVSERIIAAIRAGNYAEPAARSAGISEATFYRWMKRGEEQRSGAYRDFHEAVRRAEADAELEAVVRLRKAMPDDWRACMTYLERRYPGRWRRREAHEHTGEGGAPLRLAEVIFEDPETRKAIDEALKAAGRARARGPGGAGPGE